MGDTRTRGLKRVLLAPNAFKGCLGAAEAAELMARGVRSALPGAAVDLMPVSDGGDGLVDVLLSRRGGRLARLRVVGPLGSPRWADYALLPDGRTAVIEMARASGMAGLRRLDPLGATSFGTGQLIADALRRGRRRILVGLGGSAANDGGAGMAQAMGARLLDAEGRELRRGAEPLLRLARVDLTALKARLSRAVVIGVSDVRNPLVGPRGSARVYGPQKGASPAQVRLLERALSRWARFVDPAAARLPGAGAAGGLGFGLAAVLGARLEPGAAWVFEELDAGPRVRAADLVLTGEGSLDASSFYGKAPLELARLARRLRRPTAAVCGRLEPGLVGRLRGAGVRTVEAMAHPGEPAGRAMRAARGRLPVAAGRLAKALLAVVFLAPALRAAAPAEADALYFRRGEAGTLERSDALLEERLRAAPDDAETLWRLARGLVREGDRSRGKAAVVLFTRAEELAGKSVSVSSASADAWFWWGVALGKRGEARGMMRSLFMVPSFKHRLETALRLDPRHAPAHHALGELLWQLPALMGGSRAGARVQLEAALAADPAYTPPYSTLAEVYQAEGRKEEADALLPRILKVERPADPAGYAEDVADLRRVLGGR